MKLRIKVREMEGAEERHQIEIKVRLVFLIIKVTCRLHLLSMKIKKMLKKLFGMQC